MEPYPTSLFQRLRHNQQRQTHTSIFISPAYGGVHIKWWYPGAVTPGYALRRGSTHWHQFRLASLRGILCESTSNAAYTGLRWVAISCTQQGATWKTNPPLCRRPQAGRTAKYHVSRKSAISRSVERRQWPGIVRLLQPTRQHSCWVFFLCWAGARMLEPWPRSWFSIMLATLPASRMADHLIRLHGFGQW
jgi:hypothetical protein